jgi:hypothetical protein
MHQRALAAKIASGYGAGIISSAQRDAALIAVPMPRRACRAGHESAIATFSSAEI